VTLNWRKIPIMLKTPADRRTGGANLRYRLVATVVAASLRLQRPQRASGSGLLELELGAQRPNEPRSGNAFVSPSRRF